MASRASKLRRNRDPLWYKDASVYELHVRAFFDSNEDGIGDFPGLTEKLPYLRDLGVTAIWLLPFYPSPLKDDGYDISDYYNINPMYGTLKEFKTFLDAAHSYDLKVITELVINHTSDQHPWFQRSRRAPPGSAWRDFYVWSDATEKYKEARIIFRDFEPSNWSWDPVARAYYWHRFYAHQPDLNFDNPAVHKEITRALDFWLDLGVDGLRLDAVPYLYEREGTSCENLPETHAYLKKLRQHVDQKYGDRMLLAEANQWPEDAVSYFGAGKGDECHMAFHFPLMPRLFMAVRREDRFPIVDILDQTPSIPETSQWGLFLRNHDELTLEMVTDEERDYMYQVYAAEVKARINLGIRRRLAPLLGNDRKRIELLHLLLFSFPGTPFLYYGDEIGMGDNIYLGDRNGVRTPMQWSSDKNAGFSRANPHALYFPIILEPEYHYEAINVENQQQNLHSLWWWMKRVLTLRKRYKAFSRGTMQFLQPQNRKVLGFIRRYEDESILVVANLSRFPQPLSLDLKDYDQVAPIELFGQTAFPPITQEPYALTLAAHSAFWFLLPSAKPVATLKTATAAEPIWVEETWTNVLDQWPALEHPLLAYISERRWFGGKGRRVKSLSLKDSIPVDLVGNSQPSEARWLLLLIDYLEGDPEFYQLPIAFTFGAEAELLRANSPQSIIAPISVGNTDGLLYDCCANPLFGETLLEAMHRRRNFKSDAAKISAGATALLRSWPEKADLKVTLSKADQSNTSILFGDRFLLKLYRKLAPGINPDLEIARYLGERRFSHTAALAGYLEYQSNGQTFTLATMTDFIPGAIDAWEHALHALSRYFERVSTLGADSQGQLPVQPGSIVQDTRADLPAPVTQLLGTFLESARLLGQRTGELHLALGAETQNRDFAPESFTPFYQRSLFQSLRNMALQNLTALRQGLKNVPEDARACALQLLNMQPAIMDRFKAIHSRPIKAKRIRGHGDFHLGQVLYTGKDFVIVDFEGEPARPLGERRIKRSALRDVAGMIRSFDYAARTGLFQQQERGAAREDQLPTLAPWAFFWAHWVSVAYLRAYLSVVDSSRLLPSNPEDLRLLLEVFLLEKAIYEVTYELNNRPTWLRTPCEGILRLLEAPPG